MIDALKHQNEQVERWILNRHEVADCVIETLPAHHQALCFAYRSCSSENRKNGFLTQRELSFYEDYERRTGIEIDSVSYWTLRRWWYEVIESVAREAARRGML